MPAEAFISPQGDSANTHPRLTPGSPLWLKAILADLSAGYGVEDIALRLDCRVGLVRDRVAKLRRLGLLPEIYAKARGVRA